MSQTYVTDYSNEISGAPTEDWVPFETEQGSSLSIKRVNYYAVTYL